MTKKRLPAQSWETKKDIDTHNKIANNMHSIEESSAKVAIGFAVFIALWLGFVVLFIASFI